MSSAKLKRLQAAGWKTGSPDEFFGLSDAEAMLVDQKLSLAGAVRQSRQKRGLSQTDLVRLWAPAGCWWPSWRREILRCLWI